MTIENGESQHYDKHETLGDMVRKKFNISRKKFKANNTERLAKMAKVSIQEYISARNKDTKKNIAYNEIIRNRILTNDLFPLPEYNTVVKKFSQDQQKAIAEAFPDKKINNYLASISSTKLQNFIQLTPTQLVAFLNQETKKVQNKKEKINKNSSGSKINDATTEQLLNLNELTNVEKKIDDFINKHNILELKIDKKTGMFVDKNTEQKFQTFSINITPEQKAQYAAFKTSKGQPAADTFVRTLYQTQLLQTPEIQAKLSDEAKREFAGIVEEFYVASKKLDIDMSSFGLDAMYQKAKAYLIEIYTTRDTYQKLSYNIQSAPAVNAYFDANKKTELVTENRKDKSYYTKLLLWYPVLDTVHEGKRLSEYLVYLNDDMTIKPEASNQQKKLFLSLLPQLKEQGKPYEKKLLGLTNSLVQTVAVEQCITTLQSYMDVNISEKENVMEQLKIAENRDAVSENLIVKINGTLNGKKIIMSYNLLTGSVSYQSFMTKQTDTEHSPITIGAINSEESVPLITLPKFGDFIKASNTIDYKNAIDNSATQDIYTKKITESLKTSVQSHQNMDNEKDMLKKYILKDTITQNIFSLTGRTMDGPQTSLLITPQEYPQMHAFYNLIAKSLTYYSMGSIDDLNVFQYNIQTLLTYAMGSAKTQSTTSVLTYKKKNEEMFVLQSLVNQAIIPQITNQISDQGPEEKLLSFFKCFEKKICGLSIIDGEMMDDFFTASLGTNSQNNKVNKRIRNTTFTTLAANLTTKFTGDQASIDLEQDLTTV